MRGSGASWGPRAGPTSRGTTAGSAAWSRSSNCWALPGGPPPGTSDPKQAPRRSPMRQREPFFLDPLWGREEPAGAGAGAGAALLGGRHSAGLALLCAALIVYGSLVPFRLTWLPWVQAVGRFQGLCAAPVKLESRSDWAANALLMVPLAYLLTAALSVDRPWAVGLAA